MCLVLSLIFLATAYVFYQDANMLGMGINIGIALFFIILLLRNILKTKKERNS